MLLISKGTGLALLSPCLLTNSSNLSFLRPAAVTFVPASIKWSTIAFPMPDVAPIIRTCWGGKVMFAIGDGEVEQDEAGFSYRGSTVLDEVCAIRRYPTVNFDRLKEVQDQGSSGQFIHMAPSIEGLSFAAILLNSMSPLH